MDPEEKFKQKLLSKQKTNMHLKFLEESAEIQAIQVPIFTKYGPKKKILPYRNKNCTKPTCVYDLQELIERFKNAMYSNYIQFICYSCKQLIDIQDFYLDHTLNSIIGDVWKKHNREDRIICEHVTIMRDGHWEPNLPEYQKYIDRKMNKVLEIPSSARKVLGVEDRDAKREVVYKKQRVPLLNEFTKEEFQDFMASFNQEKLKSTEIILNSDGIPLRKIDFRNAENDLATNPTMVSYFMNYLRDVQNAYPDKYNRSNGSRAYLNVVMIKGFDKYSKKIEREFGFAFRNDLKYKPELLYQNYDKAIILLFIDERWVVTVSELKHNRMHIVDFLLEGLSRVKIDDLIDIIKLLLGKEFKIKIDSYNFYDAENKLNFYNDCGLYALNYAYKALNNELVQNLKIRYQDKDFFRKQLCWLALKMRGQMSKQVDIYKFAPSAKDDNALPRSQTKRDSLVMKSLDEKSFLTLTSKTTRSDVSKDLSLSLKSDLLTESHASSYFSGDVPVKNRNFKIQASIRKSRHEEPRKSKYEAPRQESKVKLADEAGAIKSEKTPSTVNISVDQTSESSVISMNRSELERMMSSFGMKLRKELQKKKQRKKNKVEKMEKINETNNEEDEEDEEEEEEEEEDGEGEDDDDDEDDSDDDDGEDDDEDDEDDDDEDQSQMNMMNPYGQMMYDPNMGYNPMMGGYGDFNKRHVQFNAPQNQSELFAYGTGKTAKDRKQKKILVE